MYLTYNRYRELGGELPENEFTLAECTARREVDLQTSNRIKSEFDGSQEYLEDLECLLYYLITDGEPGDERITGESTDGVSTSYYAEPAAERTARRRRLVYQMLSGYSNHEGTPLFYAGV